MCESTIEQSSSSTTTMAIPAPQPPPPPTTRRPRVREVSSRFMIPSSPSSSPLTHHHHQQPPRSNEISVQRRGRRLDLDPHHSDTEVETPSRYVKPPQTQHRRSKSSDSGNLRVNTPNVGTNNSMLRSKIGGLNSQKSAAARLLRSSGMTASFSSGNDEALTLDGDTCSIGSTSDSEISLVCSDSNNNKSNSNNSPMRAANKCKTRGTASEIRSSMPEAETRLLMEKNCNSEDSLKFWDSPCTRSLNLPLSNSSVFNSVKPSEKGGNFVKNGGGFYMPPRPPRAKMTLEDVKKGKVSSHQEDVHCLRMLHNRYLQWRYVNAKAESSLSAQKRDAESTLYSLGVAVSEMRNSMIRKRMELQLLRITKTLNTILEAQRPDLDEWASLEGDYSVALSETIQALVNTSLQLPTTADVRADPREVGEALNSALKVMEMIASNVQRFVLKAEEIDNLMSELARVTGGETTLVEECGELLSKIHVSQVEECSLRGQLIQLQCDNTLVRTVE